MRRCRLRPVPSFIATLTFTACALSLVACGNSGGGEERATATSSSTPQATVQDTAVPTTSALYEGGIPSVDAAIAALQTHDIDGLVDQMRYTRLACQASLEPLSVPPFCEGDPEGSLVDAFPTAACEGLYQRPATAEQGQRAVIAERLNSTLVGVYRTAGTRLEQSFWSHAAPSYAAVFAMETAPGAELAWGVFLNDEGIVGLSEGCGETPAEFVAAWEFSDAITGP